MTRQKGTHMNNIFMDVVLNISDTEMGILVAVFALAVTALVIYITMIAPKKKKQQSQNSQAAPAPTEAVDNAAPAGGDDTKTE